VLNQRLGEAEYVAGDYSIADIAIFPWIVPYEQQGQSMADYPNLKRWFDAINSRPAVKKGLALLQDERGKTKMDDKARDVMFGNRQYEKR
jgi:GST-like protein